MDTALTGTNGRLANGHFAKGNTLARGAPHPLANKILELKQAMHSVVSTDDMRTLTQRLLTLCQNKEPKVALMAMKLLFSRLLGKPREEISVGLDVQSHRQCFDFAGLPPEDLESLQALIAKAIK